VTNLADVLPKESKTVRAIYDHYKKVGDAAPVRGYLGASIIGHLCERYLWYTFRQATLPDISGRTYRLFETGNLEEARFVKELRAIGCEVHDVQPISQNGVGINDPEQFEVSAFGGHFSGHMDGCALGIPEAPKTWHTLEFKTHNAKSFRELKKKSVRESKPQHYAQVQIYMHLTGMKRALYLAVNKDTDELYSERIRYDKSEAEQLMERAKRVITASEPPERLGSRPDYYLCRWCDAKAACWGTESPDPALPVASLSCRQCCHATPILDGQDEFHRLWKCEKDLQYPDHKGDCIYHLVLPGLLAFTERWTYHNDKQGEWIEFQNTDGTVWKHGNAPGCYSSKELRVLPADHLANKMVQDTKEFFRAEVAEVQDDILSRYPAWLPDKNGKVSKHVTWKGPAEELVAEWKERYGEDLVSLPPIAKYNSEQYNAVEYTGARVAVIWNKSQQAEIREVVPF
jgi:hypothetical protein